jgi:uncharacterized membrane protein
MDSTALHASHADTAPLKNRSACAFGGAALLGWAALAHRGALVRSLSSAAGLGLLYHAWTGRNPLAGMLGERAAGPAISVSDSVKVAVGRDATYRFWRNLKNMPMFMARVESVEEFDMLRSRWRVHTPAGAAIEWTSEITDDNPGKWIAWRRVDGPLRHAGIVRFVDIDPEWGTEVSVEMQYSPPGGALGERAMHVLGVDPQQELREDLQRLKQCLEAQDATMVKPV